MERWDKGASITEEDAEFELLVAMKHTRNRLSMANRRKENFTVLMEKEKESFTAAVATAILGERGWCDGERGRSRRLLRRRFWVSNGVVVTTRCLIKCLLHTCLLWQYFNSQFCLLNFLICGILLCNIGRIGIAQMDGKAGGLNLNGRKMRTWLGSGTTPPVNGMETLMTKPEDWDDEEDGEWTAPTIANPEYKGPWKPKKIKNPNFKGKWKAPLIDNPDFKDDPDLYVFPKLKYVGIELWQVKSGTLFDNVVITDDPEYAKQLAEETWGKQKDAEKAAFEEAEKKREEEESKDDPVDSDAEEDEEDKDADEASNESDAESKTEVGEDGDEKRKYMMGSREFAERGYGVSESFIPE